MEMQADYLRQNGKCMDGLVDGLPVGMVPRSYVDSWCEFGQHLILQCMRPR